jgi:dsDNA-specific endonuclease/ATPase MutS2
VSIVRSLIRWLRGEEGAERTPEPDLAAADAQDPPAVDVTGSDTIDLHTFRPEEIGSVVREFLAAAVEAGHRRVRIIHGKGIGVQRRIVCAILEEHPSVVSFSTAPDASSWGATVAELKPPEPDRDEG